MKTAGSSIELALTRICGPADTITPLLGREEALRPNRPAQNYVRGDAADRDIREDGLAEPVQSIDFYGHMTAAEVAQRAPNQWENYFKFGFVRNPWDAQVSLFCWRRRGGKRGEISPEAFREYLFRRGEDIGFQMLQIGGKFAVDYIGQYENLEGDFHTALEKIACTRRPKLQHLKAGTRPPEARDYRPFYDDRSRELVATAAAEVIERFGYTF